MRNCAVAENPQMKINISNKQKHAYLCIPDQKAFKGTGANLALPSLHGGSLEITLTIPLTL